MDRSISKPRKRFIHLIDMYPVTIAAATVDIKGYAFMRDIETGLQVRTDTVRTKGSFIYHRLFFTAVSIHMRNDQKVGATFLQTVAGNIQKSSHPLQLVGVITIICKEHVAVLFERE